MRSAAEQLAGCIVLHPKQNIEVEFEEDIVVVRQGKG
jgi:hypothetical protein